MIVRRKPAALVALIALAPALALAAPKARPPKKTGKRPPDPTAPAGDPAGDKPADPAAPGPGSAAPGGGGAPAAPTAGAPASGGAAEPAARAEPDSRADKPERAGEPGDKPADKPGDDVDSLRQEYLSLRDELFKSRARANAVASQLYSTRIQVKLTYTTGRYYNPGKAQIRLDGASVYEDATGAIAGDDGIRFDGYVAPGRHLVTFRVEATGKDDDSFTSVTEAQIVVKAIAGKNLIVAGKAHDSGDIAYAWKRAERGSYGLGIDVGVETARPAADPGKGGGK